MLIKKIKTQYKAEKDNAITTISRASIELENLTFDELRKLGNVLAKLQNDTGKNFHAEKTEKRLNSAAEMMDKLNRSERNTARIDAARKLQ